MPGQPGLAVLEHDGSYPGDTCASSTHPGHRGLDDSQWTQWKTISEFYEWCRARGVYLNVPDWYFLEGVRDYDAILHVNPALKEKGLAVLHNPLHEAITRTIRLPLYYTGLTDTAVIRIAGSAPRRVTLARDYSATVTVTVPADGMVWVTVE